MEKTLKDVLKIIQAIRFQGDSVERLDMAADILIDRLDHPIEIEKTIAEKESAVLEYCQEVCPTNGQIRRFQGWHLINHGEYWSAHHTSGECIFTTKKPSGGGSGIFYKYHLAYAVCGLDKRDALEAEKEKSKHWESRAWKILQIVRRRETEQRPKTAAVLRTLRDVSEKNEQLVAAMKPLVVALTKIRKMRKTDRYWDGESMTKIAALALEAYKEGKKDA